jgi:hypothetical protein
LVLSSHDLLEIINIVITTTGGRAEKGKPHYRWSWFDVNSDAWKYDPTTDSYYLHYFSGKTA